MTARKELLLGEALQRIHKERQDLAAAKAGTAEALLNEDLARLAMRFPGANRGG